jgi:hypothetical protein
MSVVEHLIRGAARHGWRTTPPASCAARGGHRWMENADLSAVLDCVLGSSS